MAESAEHSSQTTDWAAAFDARGYAFVPAAAMRAALERCGILSDWLQFAASWNRLALDTHMADAGRYRRRRYAVFGASAAGAIGREPHQPHYQTIEYNPLHGGLERWFEPIEAEIGDCNSMQTVLRWALAFFGARAPATQRWHIEVHQFRIEARPDEPGKPTPEGVHRDGVDWVLVLLLARHNIASGTTTIHDRSRHEIGAFTLTEVFDAALVDDHRCFHGVTAVTPLDPAAPAWRDVLVVTLRAEPLA